MPVYRLSGATGAGRAGGAARAPRRASRRCAARPAEPAAELMAALTSAARLDAARRIVVKIGSALLVDGETGRLRSTGWKGLAADVAELRGQGKDVILVSSGSIALGRRVLRLPPGELVAGAEPGGRGGRADPAGAGL